MIIYQEEMGTINCMEEMMMTLCKEEKVQIILIVEKEWM